MVCCTQQPNTLIAATPCFHNQLKRHRWNSAIPDMKTTRLHATQAERSSLYVVRITFTHSPPQKVKQDSIARISVEWTCEPVSGASQQKGTVAKNLNGVQKLLVWVKFLSQKHLIGTCLVGLSPEEMDGVQNWITRCHAKTMGSPVMILTLKNLDSLKVREQRRDTNLSQKQPCPCPEFRAYHLG